MVARDLPGTTAAVTRLLAEEGVNIAFLEVAREKRGREATMIIEADHAIPSPCSSGCAASSGWSSRGGYRRLRTDLHVSLRSLLEERHILVELEDATPAATRDLPQDARLLHGIDESVCCGL